LWSAACQSFSLVNCREKDNRIHILDDRVLEDERVCPTMYASVVRVQLDVDNLLVVGSRNGDGGRELDFDRCVDGG